VRISRSPTKKYEKCLIIIKSNKKENIVSTLQIEHKNRVIFCSTNKNPLDPIIRKQKIALKTFFGYSFEKPN
jgi:hypothetical protein